MALGTQENNWLRQVGGYWEMAASLALHGAVNEDLFLEAEFQRRNVFPVCEDPSLPCRTAREDGSPILFRNVEIHHS